MTNVNEDTRWIQRLDNFSRALGRLREGSSILADQEQFDANVIQIIREGLIQRFEFTQELAWNVMKDYEAYQGYNDIRGSRDAIRKALEIGLIDNPIWMNTIIDRNRSSHDYDNDILEELSGVVLNDYLSLFNDFEKKMLNIKAEEQQ